ncbi:MAG: hypothetical protein WD534_01100 [Phycisphaeraceae bacterium]
MSLTVERSFQMNTVDRGRKSVGRPGTSAPAPTPTTPVGRVPRITRLMALAIKLESYVQDGIVDDYADLARLGHVSRARITQILDLNLLCPTIQEAILNLPRTLKGRDPVRERHVRGVLGEVEWGRQRKRWHKLLSTAGIDGTMEQTRDAA